MNRLFILILTLVTFSTFHQLKAQKQVTIERKEAFSIGETIAFKSDLLQEQRVLNIYLPQSYSDSTAKEYPVIYLLDGSADEDFIHISGLVQFGSFSWVKMLPESIVVGIANVDRRRDFTFPTGNQQDKRDFPTAGKSARFIEFIGQELQPMIETLYRTTSIQTLIGQSLGGLLATEILFKQPNLFDNYIIVSPSLWWDDESLLKTTPLPYQSHKSVYIAVGKEGAVMERTAKSLYDKLKEIKKANTGLYFDFFEQQDHGDALHLAVYAAFEKIFTKKAK